MGNYLHILNGQAMHPATRNTSSSETYAEEMILLVSHMMLRRNVIRSSSIL